MEFVSRIPHSMDMVVAGEIFAKGLTTIGTVDAVIRGAEHSGLGGIGVMIIMALVIAICAIVMGSGNAPFMSFASLIPNIAAGLHVPAVVMIMPMHFATTLARAVSPITAAVDAQVAWKRLLLVAVLQRQRRVNWRARMRELFLHAPGRATNKRNG